MSISQNILHTNSMLADFKQTQEQRIVQLEKQVAQLQEEIRLIQEFHDRIDDL
jgi:predicted ATP-binding protein involved in virulence